MTIGGLYVRVGRRLSIKELTETPDSANCVSTL